MHSESTAQDALKSPEELAKEAPKPHVLDLAIDKDGKDPIANLRKNFLNRGLPKKEEKKPEPKSEEKPKEKAEEKPPEKKEVKAPEPEKEEAKVRKVTKPEPVARIEGAEELAAATKALQATAEAMNKKPEEKKTEPRALPPGLERKVPDLKALAEMEPDKFKDIEGKVRDFFGKGGQEEQYIAQWKKENPGKKYDPEDDDHNDFYAANDPTPDEDTLEQAKEYRIEQRIKSEAQKQAEPIRREIQTTKARESAGPLAIQYQDHIVKQVAASLNPELAKLSPEKWKEADEDATELIFEAHQKYTPLANAVAELTAGVPFDNGNRFHSAVAALGNELEETLKTLDPEQLVITVTDNAGKPVGTQKFAPRAEYLKATEAQRRRLWTVDDGLILSQIGQDYTADVKRTYDRLKRKGPSGVTKTEPEKQTAEASKTQSDSDKDEEKTTSPSVGSSSQAPTPEQEKRAASMSTMPNLKKRLQWQ